MSDEMQKWLDGIEKRRESAGAMVSALCQGSKGWTMSVPARLDKDSDLVIAAALGDIRGLLAKVEEMAAAMERGVEAQLQRHIPGQVYCEVCCRWDEHRQDCWVGEAENILSVSEDSAHD